MDSRAKQEDVLVHGVEVQLQTAIALGQRSVVLPQLCGRSRTQRDPASAARIGQLECMLPAACSATNALQPTHTGRHRMGARTQDTVQSRQHAGQRCDTHSVKKKDKKL